MWLSEGRPGRDFEMTLEWRGRTLVITWLPVASMGRLAACAPRRRRRPRCWPPCWPGRGCGWSGTPWSTAATAVPPLGIYQKCAGLERRLREMGICVAGTGGR